MSKPWTAIALAFCASILPAQQRYRVSEEPAAGSGSPKVVVLRDDTAGVEAAVAPSEGGELTSLRVKFRGAWIELLYRARDYGPALGFRGKAQFLWPAVGGQYPVGTIPRSSCADGSFRWADRSYPMPCHGFAKDLPWKEAGHSADDRGARVTVELRDSDADPRRSTRSVSGSGDLRNLRAAVCRSLIAVSRRRRQFRTDALFDRQSRGLPRPVPRGHRRRRHAASRRPTPFRTAAGFGTAWSPAEQRARSFVSRHATGRFRCHGGAAAGRISGRTRTRASRDPQGLALRIAHRASIALPEPLVQFNVYGGPKQGYFCPEPWFGLQNSLNLKKGWSRSRRARSWQWTVEISRNRARRLQSDRRKGHARLYDRGTVQQWSRRDFLKPPASGLMARGRRRARQTREAPPLYRRRGGRKLLPAPTEPSNVALIKGNDRRENIYKSLKLIEDQVFSGIGDKQILIKPNFVQTSKQLAATHVDADSRHPGIPAAALQEGDPHRRSGGHQGRHLAGYKNYGYQALVKEYKVKLVDLNLGAYHTATPSARRTPPCRYGSARPSWTPICTSFPPRS